MAMGYIGSPKELGVEASAIVRRVGSAVKDFKVGDRVGLCMPGLMRNRRVVPAQCCSLIPDTMTLEEAAATYCVFATAIYSLISVGNLHQGQSVLIHSACGGVGLAAIQICRMIGAEVFVTVGNKDKAKYLADNYGISADRIFDSRSSAFVAGVMQITNRRGVDLVLNSLSGELLQASWRCVAPFGRMIELGKRDFLGHGMLPMDAFGKNRSFIGVDILGLGKEAPLALQMLVSQFYRYYSQGKLQPIRPVTVYDALDVGKGFRHMQSGQHVGKIVIRIPDDLSGLPISTVHEECRMFNPTAAYLLVGGLGGLGRAVAAWMIQKGARHLVFLSRSGSSTSETESFLRDLESHPGCSVSAVAGDVANIEDLQRAVSASPRPISGVIQMSMVLKVSPSSYLHSSVSTWGANTRSLLCSGG